MAAPSSPDFQHSSHPSSSDTPSHRRQSSSSRRDDENEALNIQKKSQSHTKRRRENSSPDSTELDRLSHDGSSESVHEASTNSKRHKMSDRLKNYGESVPLSTPARDHIATHNGGGGRSKRVLESNISQTSMTAKTGFTRKIRVKENIHERIYERFGDVIDSIVHRNNSIATFFQSISFMDAPTSSSSQNKVMSVTDALARLCTLKELVPGSHEYSFAVRMIEDPIKREILAGLPSDEAIVAWIKFMYAMPKKK